MPEKRPRYKRSGRIDSDLLRVYLGEYREGQKLKRPMVELWNEILQEFRLNNKWALFDELDYESAESSGQAVMRRVQATEGAIGYLNVFIRRWVAAQALQNPEFLVGNRRPQDEAIAWLLEHEYSNVLDEMDHASFRLEVLWNTCFTGLGIGKVGYHSEFVVDETPLAADLGRKSFDILEDDAAWPYGDFTEYGERGIEAEMINAIAVRAHDFVPDLNATSPKDLRRMFHRTRRPVEDVHRDDRYIRKNRTMVHGEEPSVEADRSRPTMSDEVRRAARCVDVIECFDVSSRKFCVFAAEDGIDGPLRDWTDYDVPIEHPYVFYRPIPDPESFWGIPPSSLILGPTRIVNLLRARTVDRIGRSGKTVVLFSSKVTEEERQLFLQAEDMTGIVLSGIEDEAISNAVEMINFQEVSTELYKLQSQFDNDVFFMGGMTDPASGRTSGGDQTATEIERREQHMDQERGFTQALYEKFLEEAARKHFRIMLDRWPDEKALQIVGPDPRVFFWINVERERVQREFYMEISVGSTEATDKLTQRRQWTELLPRIQSLIQMIQQEALMSAQGAPAGPVNLTEVLKMTIEQFDPRWAKRILRQRDPVELLQRLIQDHQMMSTYASPEFKRQFRTMLTGGQPGAVQPGLQPQGVGPPSTFEEQQGIPAPVGQTAFGVAQQDRPGFDGQRALSEAGVLN